MQINNSKNADKSAVNTSARKQNVRPPLQQGVKRNVAHKPKAPNARPAPQKAAAAKRPPVNNAAIKGRPSSAPEKKLKPQKKPTRQQRADEQRRSREELNARIRTQTPSNRQAVRNEKKIKGSIKNLEIKRRTNTSKQKFHIKKKNPQLRGIIMLGIVIFVLIFAVLFGLVAGIVALSLHVGGGDDPVQYKLQIGEELESDYSNLIYMSETESMQNGIVYIPVSALSDMCNLTVTGLTDDLRYIVRDDDSQIIRFIVGTDLAYINECKVRLSGDTFISEGKLFVPLDFFIEYSEGLTINTDHDEKLITLYRTVVGKDDMRKDILADFRFKLDVTEGFIDVKESPDDAVSDKNNESQTAVVYNNDEGVA